MQTVTVEGYLAADPSANRAGNGVTDRAEVDVLGRAAGNVSADRATHDLNNQIQQHRRHCISPSVRTCHDPRGGAGPLRRAARSYAGSGSRSRCGCERIADRADARRSVKKSGSARTRRQTCASDKRMVNGKRR